MKVSYKKIISKKKVLELRDIATAIPYGSVTSDRRVQLKMPSAVVDAIDTLFPDIDRSKFLTQLALEAVLRRIEFLDRPDLGDLVASEQQDLDDLWNYLEERERK